jgi:ABC-type multidrug transport system ATPase subunit
MILKAENMIKSFGKKMVLKGVSFSMEEGTINGIAGENGSGKSTLLKILVGLWKADKGNLQINGKIGYCPQDPLIFPQLTVDEHFQYFAAAYGLTRHHFQERRELLLEELNFGQYRKEKVCTLSGGTHQKLNLSLALLHQPDLLILDEPYNGFDWETYLCFWDLTVQMKQRGCSILVVTHLLNDRDRFDKIHNLKDGTLT